MKNQPFDDREFYQILNQVKQERKQQQRLPKKMRYVSPQQVGKLRRYAKLVLGLASLALFAFIFQNPTAWVVLGALAVVYAFLLIS